MPRKKKTTSTPETTNVLDLKPDEQSPTIESGDTQDSFADLGPRRSWRWVAWPVVAAVIVGALFGGFHLVYASKIYPGVSIDGVYLGGLSQDQAKQTLTTAFSSYQKQQILVQYASTSQAVDLTQIGVSFDVNVAANTAYAHGRTGSWGDQIWQIGRGLVNRPTGLGQFNYDNTKLTPYLDQISTQVNLPVANAALSFSDTGRAAVTTEQAGQRLDTGMLIAVLEQRIATGSTDAITAPLDTITPTVTTAALEPLKTQTDAYLVGPLKLTMTGTGKTTDVAVKDMIGWLKVNQAAASLPSGHLSVASFAYTVGNPPVSLGLDDAAIGTYVAGLAKTVDQPGQNAALTITNGTATVFQPSKTGYTLDQPAAVIAIKAGLAKPADGRTVALSIKVTSPAVTEANLNDLGINELISEGVTYFPGSPSDRLHNIRVGAARFNGVLIKPGDTFSFEDLLGNVDASTGYLPAYVILPDHTEPKQYGGGLCQVSSTAYRAALLAGLPILERHNHAYALGYYMAPYGVPGVDATVFNASVDMKFLNDTGHYILIQTILSGTTLKFDFYGTKTKVGQIRGPYFIDPAGGAGWNPTVPSKTVFYRDVVDLAGNVIKTDTVTTNYLSSSLFTLD